tara:strand:- start:5776 stop:7128 length:1353 start_codon:yes stop_codon:yes gene_type:complete
MGVNNDGLRQNLKMSDLRTAFAPPSTTAISYGDICTWTPAPNNYLYAGHTVGSGYRSAEYYLEGKYHYHATTATSMADVIDKPFIMQSFYGRYKTSTSATPTTLTHVTSTDTGTGSTYSGRTLTNKNIKMSNYVGLSQCPLTTDTCGQTRGVKNGYTTAVTVTSPGGGGFQNQGVRDPHNNNAVYSNKEIAYGLTDTNIGMSVVRTYYTNNWSDIGLNTICAEGDRVVVVATSQGGTMYTFSTTDPIYLRSTGNTAISATVTTHYGPTKNETGSDTWMAVYSAVCNAGGAARVGINPYHSGNGYYIFYIFVIKGPDSSLMSTSSFVYTTQTTTPSFHSQGAAAGWMYPNMQPYVISIVASPFAGNGHSGTLSSIVTKNLLCIAQTPIGTGHVGAGFVSVSGHGGGAGNYSTGKYTAAGVSGYSPQYAQKIPRQDARSIIIHGTRGHQFGT